jgi:hypothetical protein
MPLSLQEHLRNRAGFGLPPQPLRPARRNTIGRPLVHEDGTSVVRSAAVSACDEAKFVGRTIEVRAGQADAAGRPLRADDLEILVPNGVGLGDPPDHSLDALTGPETHPALWWAYVD